MFNSALQLQTQLELDEGFRASPYRDEFGNLTVLFGHNLSASPLPGVTYPASRAVGIRVLQQDITIAERSLWDAFPWTEELPDAQQGALINMCFNMGIGTLAKFDTFLAYMQAQNWTAAVDDLRRTPWYRQVGQRSVRLCQQIETGEWQYATS
jgi:lysozyme